MQVSFKIVVQGGGDISQLVADRLLSLEVVDRAGVKSDTLTIELDDRDQRLEIPKTGAKLEVSIGYVGQKMVRIGAYAVDEVDVSGPSRTMTIRANAADMNGGIKAPKERSFHRVTFGDLVQKVAKENELQVSISSKLSQRKLDHVDQTESDMQLLSRLCAENGATMKVADGRLVIAEHASGKTNSGKSMPKIVIRAQDCAGWNATISKRNNYKSVIAHWQSVSGGKRVSVRAGAGAPSMTLKNSYASQDEARNAAESKLNSMRRGGGTVSVRGFVGNPNLSAECTAELVGFRSGVDGDGWVVNQVTHSIGSNGYTNSIDLEAK
jgi:phage protein D